MRSRHFYFENALKKYNIKIDFYISKARSRINNKDCFSEDILKNNSDKYYLILSPEAKWNKNDDELYKSYGYNEYIDYIWYSHDINHIKIYKNSIDNDDYGNNIKSLSELCISFNGYCNNIKIGGGVQSSDKIVLNGNEHDLIIGNNCVFKPSSCVLETNSTLIIGNNVKIYGLNIYINSYSKVYIGDFTTMQTGRLRTGRNQEIIIGKDCMFSWDITFLAHDGHLIWTTNGACINNTNGKCRKSIILGDHIWIGGETVILPNTKIGNGTICGYRSLIKGSFPNNCIICGTPAKILKKNIVWSRQNFSLNESEDFKKIDIKYIKETD